MKIRLYFRVIQQNQRIDGDTNVAKGTRIVADHIDGRKKARRMQAALNSIRLPGMHPYRVQRVLETSETMNG